MSDLIDRQAAIDGKISIQRSDGLEIYSDEAVPVEYLKSLPSAQPEQRWIPVSERLPEEDGMYLISTCMNCIDTCLFYKDDDGYLWVDYEESVIAWMPLPEPYKAESEDKE